MLLRTKPPSDEGGAPKGRRERKCCVFSRTPCKTQALFSPPVSFADSPLVRGGLERTEITIPAFGERPDRRRGRKQGGERVAAVGGGRRSKDRGHPPGTATGIRHLAFIWGVFMKKKELLEVRRIWKSWQAVEALSEEERFVLEILADKKGKKYVRIEDAFDVSTRTAYRYIYAVIGKLQNFLAKNEV